MFTRAGRLTEKSVRLSVRLTEPKYGIGRLTEPEPNRFLRVLTVCSVSQVCPPPRLVTYTSEFKVTVLYFISFPSVVPT